MRVGIDGLHLFGNYSGVNGSLASLIAAERKEFPSDEIVLYVPRDFKGPPDAAGDPGLIVKKLWFPGRWRAIRTIWRNFRLQARSYKDKVDVVHGPSYALPGMLSKPAVVTIHDVIAFTHPLFCTPGSARVQKQIIPRSVKVARRIIVPSIAAKAELLRNVKGVEEPRVDLVPWGVDGEVFKPVPGVASRKALRESMKLPESYVLFVGNLEPKKNIPMLIRAFFTARMYRKLPHKLVIVGQKGWGLPSLEKLIRELDAEDYVFFTGYVPPNVLPFVYALADAFVLPSLVEGFGMPVLEAMACGCPVIISSDAALQEVGGSAVKTIAYDAAKPLQPLREAIEEVLMAPQATRDAMIQAGLERAKLFTWEKTARLTRKSYERALE